MMTCLASPFLVTGPKHHVEVQVLLRVSYTGPVRLGNASWILFLCLQGLVRHASLISTVNIGLELLMESRWFCFQEEEPWL